jgi:energy-coupling factor transport system ATP-binding protein
MTFQVDHVSFAYNEKHRGPSREVFRDMTLAIRDGECVVVLGREGCGKSTLLHLLDGLITPSRGTVLIGGKDPHADSRHGRDARRRIAYAFQFSDEQFLQGTVRDEFADYLTGRGVPAHEVPLRMVSSLSFAGLDPVSMPARSPFTLSAGEARRLVLALVHAARPEAVLLDEPSAGMDALAGSCLVEFLREMKSRKATVVIATHDVDLAAEAADRVVILDGGGAAAEGDASDILTRGALLERYGYELPETVATGGGLRRVP